MCEKSQKGKRENVAYSSVLSLASMGPAAFHVLFWFSLVRYYYHSLPDEKNGVRKGEGFFQGHIASKVETNRYSRLRKSVDERMDGGKHSDSVWLKNKVNERPTYDRRLKSRLAPYHEVF